MKIVFNIIADKKVPLDKWTIMDAIMALMYILAVNIVASFDYLFFMDDDKKDYLDYFMIFVLIISWLRFFFYFLIIRDISKLLLTIVAMVGDTLNFLIFVTCYLFLMASIFTTLYQDTNPAAYGGLSLSVRTLYDAALAVYNYKSLEDKELTHSVLLMTHVFISNILLLNYLIAILTTTYEKMKQTGVFKYKVNLYMYCERY
jgi:hypothetical protein